MVLDRNWVDLIKHLLDGPFQLKIRRIHWVRFPKQSLDLLEIAARFPFNRHPTIFKESMLNLYSLSTVPAKSLEVSSDSSIVANVQSIWFSGFFHHPAAVASSRLLDPIKSSWACPFSCDLTKHKKTPLTLRSSCTTRVRADQIIKRQSSKIFLIDCKIYDERL